MCFKRETTAQNLVARPIQANHNQIIMMGNYVGMTGNSSIKKNETDNFCEMTT